MNENKPKKDYFFYLGILGIFLFLIMLLIYAIHFSSLTPEWLQYFFSNASNDPADWGTFGDFLGGTLNPIFGLLGFMALIRTLSLQRQQLDDQRQAMQQQEKEMEAQRKSLAISNKTQIKQQFEGSFFALLNQLDQEFITTTAITSTSSRSSTVQASQSNFKDLVELYKFSLNKFSIGKYSIDLHKVFLEVCAIRRRVNRYFKILRITLISIDSISYLDLKNQTSIDKNFYVDLLIARQGKEKILALALPYIDRRIDLSIYFNSEQQRSPMEEHTQENMDFTNCSSLVDLDLKPIISRLGLLRELDFSPFNDQIFEPALSLTYAHHPITIALVETFGEQAFKPIEVPPFNT